MNRMVRLIFLGLSRLGRSYEAKDVLLAPTAPVALVAQLLTWAAPSRRLRSMLEPTTHNLSDSLLQATAALFTVGTAHAGGVANVPLDITAGAAWAVVVALQIAYLPALYSAFNKREGLVALLEVAPGSRRGALSFSPVTSSSASSTPFPTSTPPGRSGPPMERRATRPTLCPAVPLAGSPASPGSSACRGARWRRARIWRSLGHRVV